MTDSYDYDRDSLLVIDSVTYRPGCQYVFTNREISPALANRCIRHVADYWGGVELVPVAVESKWGHGYTLVPDVGRQAVRADLPAFSHDWHSCIHQAASDRTRFHREG